MKQTFIVKESKVPSGRVRVSGAKNAATRLMSAAMLTNNQVQLVDFPTELVDVQHKAKFMENVGCVVELLKDDSTALISCDGLHPRPLEHYDYPIRTTYLLAAGQLRKSGIAFIPYPGGCKLGVRKYDLHVMIWEKFGCIVEETEDCIKITGKLKATEIYFPISTVGGTENAILCACVAMGTSIIYNAYVTPEIDNFIQLLRIMGAHIEVHGNSKIVIEGTSEMRGGSIRVIPDRIETITWMTFAAVSGGSILIENIPFEYMHIPLQHFRQAGVDYYQNTKSIYVTGSCMGEAGLQPFEIACGTHPGIISDMQPFFVLLALHAAGRSKIFDYRYPERTAYLNELVKLYPGSLNWNAGSITVDGPICPTRANVKATDLRGSMVLLMATIVAGNNSSLYDTEMALRGYDRLFDKLNQLGIQFNLI